ncbi:epsilon-sarcoglycan isoform X1 [Nilaparvata lugens]|uniref:epsilon-sarcoglycan isoform X2 n=1 Tax=Nilaparvata lugens TaxID=108931 RepID=UPI00193D33DA|nr:epsilon-sarcoglycan isoform X2 [Nilaparvata lugens]XP_039292658.1 epsilon-sarcoglycan isoform X1 [Nilaparvata lugens]
MILLLLMGIALPGMINAEQIHTTKVFIMPIEPSFFNWTSEYSRNQFSYHPSLLDAPDLPPWMYYMYSLRHRTGFLYGVPPKTQKDLMVEIIGLNKRNYETRRRIVHMNVVEKPDSAQHEVQIKIDNLNVEDMFDEKRLNQLLDVFRLQLWPESAADLYVTFLASAVQLGARLPLKPNEGEGVVLRLGSRAKFSAMLLELQEEVRPLWKLGSCRGFKRTSVERILRDSGFTLDWCTFRLVEQSMTESLPGGSLQHQTGSQQHDSVLLSTNYVRWDSVWIRPSRLDLPMRNYVSEFTLILFFPMVIMIMLAILLSTILCFHHEGMEDDTSSQFFESVFTICEDCWRSKRNEDTPDVLMVQYDAVHRATSTLRSLSSSRTGNDATLLKDSPRLSSRDRSTSAAVPGARPSPPPYAGPKLNARVDF